MPSSHGRAIAAVVFAFALTLSPYAHADTSVVPIGDPYTDTLQLWSNIISAVEALANDLATSLIAIQPHASNSNDQNPQRQHPSGVAQSAAAVLATQSGSNTATSSTNQNPFATSGEPAPNATSDQTTNSSNVKSAISAPPNATAGALTATSPLAVSGTFLSPTSNFVTQDELTSQLQQLSNSLTSKINSGLTVSAWAPSQAIDQLSNVTITNANLTASEIPALNYLSLGGGTVTGNLTVNGAFSGGTLSLSTASTTNLSVFSNAYFGGTATSSFNSAGVLTLASALGVGSGGTGRASINSGSILFGNGSSALATSSNLYWDNTDGRLGIGTTSPAATLSVQGSAIFAGNVSAIAGTTTLASLGMNGNIISTLNTSAPPLSLGNWDSITTAFTGDLSHMGFGISRQTTGTSLGTPATGYLLTPELSAIASFDYNSAGYNAQTSGSGGRTGALNFYAENDNYGQGDSTSYFCDGLVDSTRSGATTFLASPEVGCLAGQLFAAADSSYLEGIGDIDFKDLGHDAAVVGLNFNFNRTNATGNLNANWGAWTFQNQGTLPIDWMLRATGAVRTALDLSALSFPDATLVSISLSNGGSGYSVDDLLSPPGGTYDQQTVVKVLTVNGSGTILTFGLDRAGLYSAAPASPSTVSGGTGTGATFVLQYSTGNNPALVTLANDCWYGNATQDTSVYTTSFSSTLKLGTSWICYSSSLTAWNFVTGNNSVLQLYNNQVIVNTNFKVIGNVGIGTTSPYSRLEVWGPDTGSTTAFAVVNNSSTTAFAVYDNGNATYLGSIFQSSDQRLKTDITSLGASSSLSAIEALNPVSYFRIDQPGTGENLGFLAQQVQQLFPELVSTTSPTALTPNGTLTLNYEGLISPIVAAIQALYSEVTSLENTIAGFAQSFTSQRGNFTDELCVGSTCVTPAQFQAMAAAANTQQSSQQGNTDGTNTEASTTPDTPPQIQINGDNPAIVQVGDGYNDLGATITGPTADLNLGIETYVNGVETSPVQIDTSAAATDTVQYVATDQSGLTATSTRTVIIEAPSIVPTDSASTTAASSTAQSGQGSGNADQSATTTAAATSTTQ